MEPIIWTENVNRVFKTGATQVHALSDVCIQVNPGELLVLRGRSGSGKTTLLNILSALDTPTSGKVFVQGKEITAMSEASRDELRRTQMSFVFQSVALMSQMSAYENVEFGLRIAGYPVKERQKRAEECLAMVGLKQRMRHRPAEMSGGEQQRVAIARAIAHHPKVLFADEPTAELDTAMGLQVMRLLRELVESEGVTVVMTTHDPNMMELADHVYSMQDGTIVDERYNADAATAFKEVQA
jgi:putative ABC transport system ATP-binding protein